MPVPAAAPKRASTRAQMCVPPALTASLPRCPRLSPHGFLIPHHALPSSCPSLLFSSILVAGKQMLKQGDAEKLLGRHLLTPPTSPLVSGGMKPNW